MSCLFAAASIISAAISLSLWSRCSAKTSSGQCRSRMKDCRASNFQSMSSDVAHPFLQQKRENFAFSLWLQLQTCFDGSIYVIELSLILCVMPAQTSYPWGFHVSFSKPLWIDWAMDDSIKSTYLTTWGAKTSLRWLWNFPPARFSARYYRFYYLIYWNIQDLVPPREKFELKTN